MKSDTLSLTNIINELKLLKSKYLLLLANKFKVPDPRNAIAENYEPFLGKKNIKSVKESEIITYQPNTFDTVDIKSVITEHPKTSHKLSKIIRQAEKVSSNSSLHIDPNNSENV